MRARWYDITRAPATTLSESGRSRLLECADQIELSWHTLQDAYLDSRSGLNDLSRRLLRLEPSVTLEADIAAVPRARPPVWPADIAFLANLARELEQFVERARDEAAHLLMSEAARTALRQDGGLLLIKSGCLRELQARLSA